jgi:hypothetical protein
VKRTIVFGLSLLVVGTSHVMAQNCVNASTAGMTAGQMNTLISNKYACANFSPTEHWNELHASAAGHGNVLDYKKGPTDPIDPSDTAGHPTGTFTLANGPGGAQGPGTITYTYPSGSFGYYIVDNLSHPQYSFCGESGGAPQLAVTISPSHC